MANCHGCSQSFGFLQKEVGCPSCGFSYCKKCLKFKVSSDDDAQKLATINSKPGMKKGVVVCRNCYYSINDEAAKNQSPQFKDAVTLVRTLQRLESMENPFKPPITLYREAHQRPQSNLDQLKSGLSEADQRIVERLEGLKKDMKGRRKSDQLDEDVEARLARLRGEEPAAKSGGGKDSKIVLTQKPESDADLLNRLGQEVKLDQEYDTSLVQDIEERLSKLRPLPGATAAVASGQNIPATTNEDLDSIMDSSDENDDGLTEEEQVQKLMKKFMAEVALEAKTGQKETVSSGEQEMMETEATHVEDVSDEDSDDDNYCELCNENPATLKCKSCDNDIFCKKCFHEFHVEIGELHKPTSL